MVRDDGQGDRGHRRIGLRCSIDRGIGEHRSGEGHHGVSLPASSLPSAWFECDGAGPWAPEGNVRRYLSGFYLLDPFYEASIEGVPSGCYALDQVAPDHFKLSEYYLAFYRHSYLEDEINYILQLDNGLSLAVSLAFTDELDDDTRARFTCISLGCWLCWPSTSTVIRPRWADRNRLGTTGPRRAEQLRLVLAHRA